MKDQHRKHYNSLITKATKCTEENERIRLRHLKKYHSDDQFESTFSGVDFANAAHKLSLEIDKMVLEEVVEDAQNET